jgi:hypothetical protein
VTPQPLHATQTAVPPQVANATRARKRRVLTAAAVTLTSCAAAGVMLNLLGARFHARIDATATGEQQLAPRTRALLESAGTSASGYRVIVATDLRATDPRARTNLSDVLDAMRAYRPDFAGTIIDTSSPSGVEQFRTLSRELYERDKPQIDAHLATLAKAAEAAKLLETDLVGTLSPQLLKVRDAIPAAAANATAVRSYYENAAAALRVRAGDLSRAIADAAQLAPPTTSAANDTIPATDKAAATLRTPVEGASRDMAALARELDRMAQAGASQVDPAAAEAARIAAAQASQARDRAALILESLKSVTKVDATRVADVLKAGSAALVLAPEGKGVVAIDPPSVLPSGAWLDAAQASNNDLRRRVEDILATSIASLASPVRPVLVLMHAEQRPFLLESGWTDALRERLALRGIDCVEWCVITTPGPDLSSFSDAKDRPKVYLTLATNDSAAAPTQGALTGAQRAAKLAEEVDRLLSAGTPVIVSLAPSMLPTYGEQDPMTKVLQQYGIDAKTGTPLLTDVLTQRGRTAETDRIVQGTIKGDDAHPLAGAVRGVPTYMTWAIPIEQSAVVAARAWPVLTVPVSGANPPTTWSESEWQRFRSVRREERALMSDAPAFTQGRDAAAPAKPLTNSDGWTVVAAAEATQATGTPTRIVVVGSNDWFIDQVTQQGTVVDGRPAFQNPGNLELLENSLLWLTRQDQLIAQSATARATPIVKAIPDAPLRMLRIAVIAGLPALVLLCGGIARAVRK